MTAKASGIACANIGLAAAGESDLSHHEVEGALSARVRFSRRAGTDAARFVAFTPPLRLPDADA
jgi:hypothetical protein